VHSSPAIGQGLRDHYFCPLIYKRTKGSTERPGFYGDQAVMDAALEEWKQHGTGLWNKFATVMGIGYFKLDDLPSTPEFQSLPPDAQAYLNQPTVPHFEILTHFPIHLHMPDFPASDLDYSCLLVFPYNMQGRGTVSLQSSDPNTPLLFDPQFLQHPFDQRVAVDALRHVLRFARSEAYARDTIGTLAAPPSESDTDLLAYAGQTVGSSWHMSGTVRMGRPGEADAAVDADFRVMGVEGLRVVDMSVAPVLPSGHVQTVACKLLNLSLLPFDAIFGFYFGCGGAVTDSDRRARCHMCRETRKGVWSGVASRRRHASLLVYLPRPKLVSIIEFWFSS
jgi:choline dehydrogenase-like flavoprotein